MPNWPVRGRWEYLRKTERHFPIKPGQPIELALVILSSFTVRPKYVDHLQRWFRIFGSEEIEMDLPIWIPTEISGIFGIMKHPKFTTKFSPILIGLNWSRGAMVFIRGETRRYTGRLPFDQNFRNFRNGDKWYVNFQGKVPENSEIVEFPKSEPFNRKFGKFSEIMRIHIFFFYSKLVLWGTITARWTSHAGMMWTNIQKWTNILVWNLATCLSVL